MATARSDGSWTGTGAPGMAEAPGKKGGPVLELGAGTGRITIPGLEADRGYRVEAIFPLPADADYAHNYTQVQPPAWLADGAQASGRFLSTVGLPMPILNPEHAVLLRFTAVEEPA